MFLEAGKDLLGADGRGAAVPVAIPPRALAFRESSIANDGARFWVAQAGAHVVGYVIATLRNDVWYLASLHIRPRYQSRGIGSELLGRSLAGTGPRTALTVLTDARNL